MTLYTFLFCDCIHESAFATMSIHLTKTGAYRAMNKYLNDSFNERRNYQMRGEKRHRKMNFFMFEAWKVGSIEVQE